MATGTDYTIKSSLIRSYKAFTKIVRTLSNKKAIIMSIPKNITKEHLLSAISKIDQEGIPPDGDSRYYDVTYNEKKYPPKLIVSYANLFANGEILDRNSFEGGLGTPCFKLLEESGFKIIKKEEAGPISFFDELIKFLDQVKSGKLGTLAYKKEYSTLKVKVSFGQGNQARIPWIAFLKGDQTVSKGIYPVYLFYKDLQLLILAYGVSETTLPDINWNLPESQTIEKYFNENNLGLPKRYGQSFVFKTYDTSKSLIKYQIDNDLFEITELYKGISLKSEKGKSALPTKTGNLMKLQFKYQEFYNKASTSNFFINKDLCLRFIASLLTKPFVILTGLSGSGKTKLAQAFAMWICENENQYSIIPVGADWTNREPLLGFANALNEESYVLPDNGALHLILEASKNENKSKPYFLILDEMNLSHVERYFADFLSLMESMDGKGILLHAGSDRKDNSGNLMPKNIVLPKNLFIVGTVNIDETTYMFSPKVLDRANVIEFRVTTEEMDSYLNNNKSLDLNTLIYDGSEMSEDFVSIANNTSLKSEKVDELNKTLITFFKELKKTGAEFGYRSVAEILRFTAIVNKIEPSWSMNEIIDAAIMQKLLPKVHGSRRKLEPVLKTLGKLCLNNPENIESFFSPKPENLDNNPDIKYPISFEKILRMNQGLINNGFTSYAEA